jgi:hypothetical protein
MVALVGTFLFDKGGETSNDSPSPAPQTTTQPKTATRGPPK